MDLALTCDNGSGPGGAGNTDRSLTHRLDLGERGLAVKATQNCSIPECPRPLRARGWCATHYARWSKHGDPLKGARPVPADICEAPDCEKPAAEGRGRHCVTHWARKGRLGSFDLPGRVGRYEHSMGYQIVKVPNHPLSRPSQNGWLYEHRAILFDAIGPGWHACHHCGMQVSWELTYPESLDALVVDHVDEDRANNDRDNLVPSCAPCNFARSRPRGKRRRKEKSA